MRLPYKLGASRLKKMGAPGSHEMTLEIPFDLAAVIGCNLWPRGRGVGSTGVQEEQISIRGYYTR